MRNPFTGSRREECKNGDKKMFIRRVLAEQRGNVIVQCPAVHPSVHLVTAFLHPIQGFGSGYFSYHPDSALRKCLILDKLIIITNNLKIIYPTGRNTVMKGVDIRGHGNLGGPWDPLDFYKRFSKEPPGIQNQLGFHIIRL